MASKWRVKCSQKNCALSFFSRNIAPSKPHEMKQPELGKKILEFRNQKGLTQEELVEKCNISVRTIQRIEAGEVMPRSYTVKTILNALDQNLNALSPNKNETDFQFDINQIGFSPFYLKMAWICGIIYFLSGFVEFAADYARFFEDHYIMSPAAYISMKFIVLGSYIYFIWGFVVAGKLFKNYLLKISAFILIGTNILFYGYDMFTIYNEIFYEDYVLVTQSIFYGFAGFLFGFALLRLAKPLGTLATVTGGLKIASSVMFIMVFTALVGYIFLIPAVFLQIILLFKIAELLKSKNREMENL